MGAKRALARNIVSSYHDAQAPDAAEAHFDRVVRRGEQPEEIPDVEVARDGAEMWLAKVMVITGWQRSISLETVNGVRFITRPLAMVVVPNPSRRHQIEDI